MKLILILAVTLAVASAGCPFGYGEGTLGKSQPGTAAQKTDNLMKQVKADQGNYGWYSISMPELFIESMATTFDVFSDYMPCQSAFNLEQRKKLIHSVGLVARCKYVSTGGHPYTGVWKGADNVIVRVSSAKQADPSKPFVAPGVGVKFMRDNVHSADYVAMYALDGQKSFNFFEHDWTNHVPDIAPGGDIALTLLKKKFLTASAWPTMLGLKDTASIDQRGQTVGSPQYPFRLVMHPSKAAHTAFSSSPVQNDDHYYTKQLKGQKFDVLWEVYAQATPETKEVVKIGEFQMTSPFYESKFGDKDLFFQHHRMEDDFKDHPEWVAGATKIVKNQQATAGYRFQDLPIGW